MLKIIDDPACTVEVLELRDRDRYEEVQSGIPESLLFSLLLEFSWLEVDGGAEAEDEPEAEGEAEEVTEAEEEGAGAL